MRSPLQMKIYLFSNRKSIKQYSNFILWMKIENFNTRLWFTVNLSKSILIFSLTLYTQWSWYSNFEKYILFTRDLRFLTTISSLLTQSISTLDTNYCICVNGGKEEEVKKIFENNKSCRRTKIVWHRKTGIRKNSSSFAFLWDWNQFFMSSWAIWWLHCDWSTF